MATMRSSSGRSSIKALSSVVFPDPVPPETRTFCPIEKRIADELDLARSERPELDQVRGGEAPRAEAPDGDGGEGGGRGNADGDPAPVLQVGRR